jgi:hypothetical protein
MKFGIRRRLHEVGHRTGAVFDITIKIIGDILVNDYLAVRSRKHEVFLCTESFLKAYVL